LKHFPAICVDNFFNDPDSVREFALSQEYIEEGLAYPGSRSDSLAKLDYDFFNSFCKKIIGLFNNYDDVIELKISAKFQKIKKFSDIKELNTGWIHRDDENVFAGLVYLTPNAKLNSGTSLYTLKDNEPEYVPELNDIKKQFFNGTLKDNDIALSALQAQNSRFIETVRFNNLYNRLICYDASVFHGANNLDLDEERLTLVFFVTQYHSKSIPLIRVRDVPEK